MKDLVRNKLEELRREYEDRPQEELHALGWKELGVSKIGGKKYALAVWSETYEDKLLLVAQAQRSLFLPFVKQTDCIGSLVSPDGTIEHVNEEFMWQEIGHP
jgi:hypothetical protein